MSDKKRLECRVCGFKSDNLVDHINEKHANHPDGSSHPEGVLVWYMINYGVDENGVVHPEYGTAKEEVPVSKSAKIELIPADKTRESSGLPKGLGGEHVPNKNDAYHFGDIARDVIQDIEENKRILLIGHTGCGKTSMITEIAARINQGVLRVNLNGQTTIGDFVGLYTVKGGETVWVDGALPKAAREGLWLIIDELDFGEPAILSVLQSILERGGKLMLKEKGHEVIEPHPNFRIFATANAVGCMAQYRGLYQGTNIMNEAFLDRWRCYHIDYLPADEEAQVIAASVPRMTLKIAKVIVKVGNMVRESFKKEDVQCTMSLRRLIDWAELMVRYKDPVRAAGPSIFSKVSPEDAKVIEGIIKRVMIGQPEAKEGEKPF